MSVVKRSPLIVAELSWIYRKDKNKKIEIERLFLL